MKHCHLFLLVATVCWAIEPGFEPLFDGATRDGWTVEPRENAVGRWTADASALMVEGRPGNLATRSEFRDFDLRLDWKIGELGNSGVFYRVSGDGNPANLSVEYQIADNARRASRAHPNRRAGAAYGLYAPSEDASLPPGEWNSLRIVARGTIAQHWLNGRKVVEFDVASEDFRRRAETAKKGPQFAQAPKGRIVLQDHNHAVWFRNLRIRRLD